MELINPDEYIVVKYWGEKGLYGWVVCKNKNETLSPAFDSKDMAYDWLQKLRAATSGRKTFQQVYHCAVLFRLVFILNNK